MEEISCSAVSGKVGEIFRLVKGNFKLLMDQKFSQIQENPNSILKRLDQYQNSGEGISKNLGKQFCTTVLVKIFTVSVSKIENKLLQELEREKNDSEDSGDDAKSMKSRSRAPSIKA